MKRLWAILLIGLLAAAVAAPAAAAKGKPKPPAPEHPAGMSCQEAVTYDGATHQVVSWAPADGDRVQVTLTQAEPIACIDVTNAAKGDFTIEVIDPGKARTVKAGLRDSHPGDFCYANTDIDLRATRTLTFSGMPAATVNACGVEYSEWFLDETGNPSETFAQTGEPDPLALTIGIRTPATVQLTVTYQAG